MGCTPFSLELGIPHMLLKFSEWVPSDFGVWGLHTEAENLPKKLISYYVSSFQFLLQDFQWWSCHAIHTHYDAWEIDQMRMRKCQLLLTLKMMLLRFPFCFPSTLTRPNWELIIFQGICEGTLPNCPTTSIWIAWKSKEIKYKAIIHELHLTSI